MTLSTLRLATLTALTALSMGAAHAGIINFISLTEASGGYGESAWTKLSLSVGGATVDIRGAAADDDAQQFAYLDWGNAGLGVCKDLFNDNDADKTRANNRGNLCNPSSDDNTTVTEYLSFTFDKDVVIQSLWFNNNHDGGFNNPKGSNGTDVDQVRIDGSLFNVTEGYAGGANGIGTFTVRAGYDFRVAYANEEFYMSGMSVILDPNSPNNQTAVPEPASLALAGLALCGLAATRRRRV